MYSQAIYIVGASDIFDFIAAGQKVADRLIYSKPYNEVSELLSSSSAITCHFGLKS